MWKRPTRLWIRWSFRFRCEIMLHVLLCSCFWVELNCRIINLTWECILIMIMRRLTRLIEANEDRFLSMLLVSWLGMIEIMLRRDCRNNTLRWSLFSILDNVNFFLELLMQRKCIFLLSCQEWTCKVYPEADRLVAIWLAAHAISRRRLIEGM